MSARTDRLTVLAQEAIREYNANPSGESVYPAWADDVLELCMSISSMANTLMVVQQMLDATADLVQFKAQA
jgi:hypothetical protein